MTQEEAVALLQKYLDGKADEKESSQIREWYSSLPVNDPLPDDHKMLIGESMRAHVKDAIRKRGTKTGLLYRPWVRVAAMLLMLTSCGIIFWKTQTSGAGRNEERRVCTSSHERKEITMSDGSTVLMEPSSEIVYPARFSSAIRSVKLISGDAFFCVAHERKRPFSVRLNSHIQVKVLGTSFRIHDISNQDLLKITVATGKVAIQKGTKMLGTLTRGQELNFHKKTEHASVSRAIHPNIVKLYFEGSSLAQVIRNLEYVYDIHIKVSNPQFLELKCRAEFNSGQQPAEILDILCSLHHLRFSQSKDHHSFNIYR